MKSEHQTQGPKHRPFPWRCTQCGKEEIYPKPTDYTTVETHDGRSYVLILPDLSVPTCRYCGDQLITTKVDEQITSALRSQIGLLTPCEIQSLRNEHGLSSLQMAEELGVPETLLADWEMGMRIQSRAMDDLLRHFFQSRVAGDRDLDLSLSQGR